MSDFVHAAYDSAGNILRIESGIARYLLLEQPGIRDDTHFVDLSGAAPSVKAKGPLILEHEQVGLSIMFKALPAGVLVSTPGGSIETDGGPLKIEFDVPGTYTIEFSGHVEYLDTSLEVTVG